MLPFDSIFAIINLLNVPSLLRLTETSKHFYTLITQTPKINEKLTLIVKFSEIEKYQNHIDIGRCRVFQKVKISHMNAIIHQNEFWKISKRFHLKIKEMLLVKCLRPPFLPDYESNYFNNYERPFKNLKKITIQLNDLIQFSVVRHYLQQHCSVLASEYKLEEMKILNDKYDNCADIMKSISTQTNLRKLELNFSISSDDLKLVLQMQHLKVFNCDPDGKLKFSALGTKFESNIEVLRLRNLCMDIDEIIDFIRSTFPKLKDLSIELFRTSSESEKLLKLDYIKTIKLSVIEYGNYESIKRFAMKNLHYLNVDHTDMTDWKIIVKNNPNIKHLVLRSFKITTELLTVILEGLPHLQRLEITAKNNPTEIDVDFLKYIYTTCTNLTHLQILTLVGFRKEYKMLFKELSEKQKRIKRMFGFSNEPKHTSFEAWCRLDEAKKKAKKRMLFDKSIDAIDVKKFCRTDNSSNSEDDFI